MNKRTFLQCSVCFKNKFKLEMSKNKILIDIEIIGLKMIKLEVIGLDMIRFCDRVRNDLVRYDRVRSYFDSLALNRINFFFF